ncbi:S-adenosyl-L-methionine-dependent methyltransferase [Spinellus fusiger]|nr:S-adenosyl-L-methionine-dependent methyltransferase [Spinellus fusiger]
MTWEKIDTVHLQFCEPTVHLPNNIAHNGAGHHYYFNKQYNATKNILSPLSNHDHWTKLYPSWKPNVKKLATLDLFCGSGNFARGVEDSGAVDVDEIALETYSVNSNTPHTIHNESVNSLLKNTILGNPPPNWPTKGEVDFIIAGNPCQGFSRMNNHIGDAASIKKSSLLASVCSYVDYYRPRYFLIENVANLVRFQYKGFGALGNTIHPFKQTIDLFVAMGYQIRWGVLDAASYGLPQTRHRVFIWGAVHIL